MKSSRTRRAGWRLGSRDASSDCCALPAPGSAPDAGIPASFPPAPIKQSLAPYVPTPEDVVERMLRLAQTTRDDVVFDLGSGDGRIPIAAAKRFGARGVGVDIDPRRIEESRANAKAAGVEHLVEFRLGDALKADVSTATVVTLYMLGSGNAALRPVPDETAPPRRAHRVARVQHGPGVASRRRGSFRQRSRRRSDALSLEG